MDELPEDKTIGVVLVDNIPSQNTDNQFSHFFANIDDVSSIQYIYAEDSGTRSCWIHFSKPAETIKKINVTTIADELPRARLMGYQFSA